MNPSHETEDTSSDISGLNIPKRPRPGLSLVVEEGHFAICRLEPDVWTPAWVRPSSFSSISRSRDELSIVCEERLVPEGVRCERDWRAIRVAGALDFSLIGVLDSLAQPLTKAKVSIFCVSTFDTDYLLVRSKLLERAIATLTAAGHVFGDATDDPATAATDTRAPASPAAKATAAPVAEPKATEEESVEEATEAEATEAEESLEGEATTEKVETPSEAAEEETADSRPPARDRVSEALAKLGEALKPKSWSSESAAEEATKGAGDEPEPSVDDFAAPESGSVAGDDEDLEIEVEVEGDDDELGGGMFTGGIPQHPVELTDKSFGHLGLSNPILETVHRVGFIHPTPIQAKVIPEALKGADVIGLAETGSGKTGAFCLPLAEKLTHGRGVRGLILSPTREIALQTKSFLDIFGEDHSLHTVLLIGGVKMGPQITGLRKKPDILVATPGRLADHLRRGNVRLDKLEELVLDEADHMLDLGFLPQIKEILEQAPKKRRTMMFSATMPPPIERLAQMFMHEPVRVDIRPVGQVAEGIEHRLYLVRDEDRKACMLALLRELTGSTLIFTRRKVYTEWLARQLEIAGLAVERIHSDRSQAQRVQALRGFREGKYRILVATDVAARGIDVPRIEHVINYGLPETIEDYVHRAGRTARGNSLGIVSSIGTWQDKIMVREIERTLSITMPRCTVEGVEPYVELPKRRTVRRRRLL